MLPLWSELIDAFRAHRRLPRLQGRLGNQAVILKATGDLEGAMRLHKEEEAICRRLNDPAGLASQPGQPGSDPEGHRRPRRRHALA